MKKPDDHPKKIKRIPERANLFFKNEPASKVTAKKATVTSQNPTVTAQQAIDRDFLPGVPFVESEKIIKRNRPKP